MPFSPIRKLAPLARRAEEKGRKIFSLNIGQPDLPSPVEAFVALTSINRKVLEYSPSDGLPELRRKLSGYYASFGMEVKESEIVVTTGGSEAVLFGFLACLDAGDEVIIPEPAYANYIAYAKIVGAKIVPVVSDIENGFGLPPIHEFEKLITPRTKGILICNPNNPTGYVYNLKELLALGELVKKHDLFLFSDEVYREFCYTDEPYVSVLQIPGIENNVVVIDSVSKRYNLCGIRIGDLVTKNKELYKNVMKFAQARLSPPLLGQLVATSAIDCTRDYMERTFKQYEERRDILVNGLNEIPGVFSPMPKGAFYTVASLPVKNAEEFCKWCLTDFEYEGETVFMAPAAGFYTTPGMGLNQVRIAYVLDPADLRRALVVLRKALETYKEIEK